jgi:hypothetical protein
MIEATGESDGSIFAELFHMKDRSTEEQNEKIDVIKGNEVLGYEGAGREEHSGQNSPEEPKKLTDELADNQPNDRD